MAQNTQHDHYFKLAKKEGYLARSAYKLMAAEAKYGLLKPGDAVLDLGAYPGSWMQYCSKRLGPKRLLVGVDRRKPESLDPETHFLCADVLTLDLESIRAICPRFDVVLSDMAPDTTGDAFVDGVRSYELSKRALDIAVELLKPGGKFFCKIFQSEEFAVFLQEVRQEFRTARVFKPPSSKKASRETFVVGLHKRA